MSVNKNKKWITSKKYTGVRFYYHERRKHGVKFDKMYGLRYQLDGKTYRNILGWASEGWTEEKASAEMSKFKENYRLALGVVSLTEKRQVAKEEKKAKELLQLEEERKLISVSKFWDEKYWPAQQHKAKGTLRSEKALFKYWLSPIIGKKSLISVTQEDFEKIKLDLLSNNKAYKTIHHAYTLFSQIWNLAKSYRIVEGDCPIKKKGIPKIDNRRDRYLTKAEAELLLSNLKLISTQLYNISLLSIYTGMRFGEIASLTWHDINFESETISILDPKSRKNRKAFFTSHVRTMLEERKELIIKSGNTPNGLVFPSRTGAVMSSVSHAYCRLVTKLFNQGISDSRQKVCFHTLRHTFASWHMQSGTDLLVLKELMGHEDIAMTLRYSHLAPDGLRKAVEVLG